MLEQYRSRTDIWFAWYPIRLGALGTGPLVWLRKVWRNRCMGVAIYAETGDIYDPVVSDDELCRSIERHRQRVRYFEQSGHDFNRWFRWKLTSGTRF